MRHDQATTRPWLACAQSCATPAAPPWLPSGSAGHAQHPWHVPLSPCLVARTLGCHRRHGGPGCRHGWLPLVVVMVMVGQGHGHGGGHRGQVCGVGVVGVHGALVAHVRRHGIIARHAGGLVVVRRVGVRRGRCCWLEVACWLRGQQPGRGYAARGVLLVALCDVVAVLPVCVVRLRLRLGRLRCWGRVHKLAAGHRLAA